MLKRILLLSIIALCWSAKAHAGTCPASVPTGITNCFYADYSSGADTNTGADEAHPWKHIPGMLTAGDNCTNTCAGNVPSAGRGYILKGGVTWPATTMPLLWTWLGSGSTSTTGCTGSGCIYIGVDQTWFSGRVNAVIPSQDMGGCSNGTVTATVTGGGGSGATVSVVMIGGRSDFDGGGFLVSDYTLTAAGGGYTSNPIVNVSGTGCNGVQAVADIHRAVFDAGNGVPAWTDSQLNLGIVSGNKATNTIWDSIDIRNIGFNTLHAGNSPSIFKMIESPNVTATNLYIHNWFTLEARGTGGSDGSIALNLAFNSTNSSSLATGNYVHNGQPTYTCSTAAVCGYGTGIQAAAGSTVLSNVINNHVSFANWAVRGCPLVISGNEIWGVIESDNGGHTNLFYATLCGAGSGFVNYVKNNRYHDNDAGAFSQITQTTNGVYWMYNNVCTQFCGNGSSFVIDPVTAAPTGTWTMNMFNNTFVVGTSDCMNIGSGGANYAGMTLNIYNNACVTTQAGVAHWFYATSTQAHQINGVTSPTNNTPDSTNYIPLPSTFLAASYTPANSVNPTSSGSPTQGSVFHGTNLNTLGFVAGATTDLATANAVPGAIGAPVSQPSSAATWSSGPQIFGSGGSVSISPTSVSYGTVTIGSSSTSGTITLTNSSGSTITLTGVSYSGANASDFSTGASPTNTCGSGSVTNGSTCVLSVKFSPTAVAGTHETATLNVAYTGFAGSPKTVALDGTAGTPISPIQPAPAPQIFTGKLTVLPLPAAPPVPIIASALPQKSYLTKAGFSQDGITFVATLPLNLSGSNISGTPTCLIDGTAVPCACGSATSCVLSIPSGAMALPTASTDHVWSISFPGITPVSVPVLN